MKVVMIVAVTLDGKIARNRSELVDWTSYEDKSSFAKITREAEIVVMGRCTFETLQQHPLLDRINLVLTTSGEKRMPPRLKKGKVYFISLTPAEIIGRLKKRGRKSAAIIGGNTVFKLFFDFATEFFITVEPLIFGKGLPLLEGIEEKRFQIKEVQNLNNKSILLHLKKEESE